MKQLHLSSDRPGLLVSVRNAAEAIAALEGGADVIDIKEPERGSLGAADARTIGEVVAAVGGRVLVTAAMGELLDWIESQNGDVWKAIPVGVSLYKFGLAGCATVADWQQNWARIVGNISKSGGDAPAAPVAVVYADWREARAPSPNDVLVGASSIGCPALLIDTWNKSSSSLFECWPSDDLRDFIARVRGEGLKVVLAGSLKENDVASASRLMPDLVAVRTAACDGGRNGTVCVQRVRKLKQELRLAMQMTSSI